MDCASCCKEIKESEMKASAHAGTGVWCPACVKRLRINIKSKEIISTFPQPAEQTV